MIGATRSPYSILLACAKRKQIEGDTGSVTADYNVIGVRPSSGAASTGCSDASDSTGARSRSDIAAPEDGRTPPRLSPAVADTVRPVRSARKISLEQSNEHGMMVPSTLMKP